MTRTLTRRDLVRDCIAAAASLLSTRVLASGLGNNPSANGRRGAAQHVLRLNQDWAFGEKLGEGAFAPDFDENHLSRVTLPHCVAKLSWQNWDPASWQRVWLYRRRFSLPREFQGLRMFLDFDRAMIGATPAVNGHAL